MLWINSRLPSKIASEKKNNLKCYWILNDLSEPPKCKCCGKTLTADHFCSIKEGYKIYCSDACFRKCAKPDIEKTKKTNLKRYGKEFYSQTDEFKERFEATSLKNFGTKNPASSKKVREKIEQTSLKNYGNKCSLHGKEQEEMTKATWQKNYNASNPMKSEKVRTKVSQTLKNLPDERKSEIKVERQKTCIDNFGVDHQFKSKEVQDKCKKSCKDHFGEDNFFKTDKHKANLSDPEKVKIRMEKQFRTKQKNGTLNTSKPEQEAFWMLKFIFPKLETQYKSDAYPFCADFYDPDQPNVRFEFQGSWTHGGHPFDPTSEEDQKQLRIMQEKGTKYYLNAIDTWTRRDPMKREVAKKNEIVLIEFWNIEEVRRFVVHYFEMSNLRE